MRVIGYLESSFWTMRSAEFGTMLRVAYSHAEQLDSLLAGREARESRPSTLLAKPGQRLEGTRYVEMRGSVAVVDVNGIIAKRMDMFDEICLGGTSTEKLMKDIRTAVDDPKVESIVLNIDSPGGEAFGINELAQSIYEARGKKPIKAYVSGLGCSGAYWIACAADEVICDRSAFLGSIGVVTAWTDDTEMYRMLGIRKETIVSSNAPKKRLDFDDEADRAELQREIDSIEKVFVKAVARNRGVSTEQVINDFNQGGVLAGADAVKAGMADRTGSLEEVIKELQSKRRKQMAAGASAAAAEGDMEMGFREEFKSFAQRLGFSVAEDGQQVPVVTAAAGASADTPPPAEPGESTEEVVIDQQEAASDEDAQSEQAEQADELPAAPAANISVTVDAAAAIGELQALRAQVIAEAAASFVDAEVKAGRLFPAEREACTALYTQLASMDDQGALESFKAMQSARKPHGLTEELVDAEANQVVLAGVSSEAVSEDRTRELLEKSTLGRASLKVVQKA